MTQSLKERLAERLESQTAEIETLTAAELKKLASGVQRHASAELERIKNAIQDQSEDLSSTLRQLSWLKTVVAATWACLLVSLMATGFLIWRSNQQRPPFMTFPILMTEEGQPYAMLPIGTQALDCERRGELVPCLLLPRPRED